MQKKGKIFLLVGYLGSGKTTLIRNLLQNKKGQKYAVIQNQFAQGQMGIQQPLIMDESGVPFSSFLQLPNGCICCSAKTDLIAAVQYILLNTQVKNIVVETNGLADPAEAIKQFWFQGELQEKAQLYSIIAVVSVKKYAEVMQIITEKQQKKQVKSGIQIMLEKQIVYSNKILLTFCDQYENQNVEKIEGEIKKVNGACTIARYLFLLRRSNKYDVMQFLGGEGIFSLDGEFDKQKINQHKQQTHNHNHDHDHDHDQCLQLQKHPHDQKIKQTPHTNIISVFLKGQIKLNTKSQFQQAVGLLLWQSGLVILRIKGAILLKDSHFVYELQGVQDIFQLKQTKTLAKNYGQQSKILVIGENLEEEYLKKSFKIL